MFPHVTADNNMLALVHTLPIPKPWDRSAFIENLGRMRGRRITLVPCDTAIMKGRPGLWLARETDDVIVYDIGSSEYDADQVILHNIGHMLLEHRFSSSSSSLTSALLPAIDPATVRRVLGGQTDDDKLEHDADMFAAMVRIAAADALKRSRPRWLKWLRRRR